MVKVILILALIFFFSLPLFAQSVDTEWVKRYNGIGSYWDRATGIKIDASGNVLVTGSSYGVYATVKYDQNGREEWARIYWTTGTAPDYPTDMAVDASGNVYVTGYSSQTGYDYEYATIKYYPDGTTAWERRYGLGSYALAYAIALDDSEYVYVTGTSGGDYATIKYNSDGDTVWVRRLNGGYYDGVPLIDVAYAIALDVLGNIYVTGTSSAFAGMTIRYSEYSTIKYYPDGQTAWQRNDFGSGVIGNYASDIATDDSGNVYVTGRTYYSDAALYDYATVKYYLNGSTAWAKKYNGPANGWDLAVGIAIDVYGNVYVAGQSAGIGTGYDYATVKYYPNGDTAWVRRYNGPGNSDDYATAIAIDDSGNVYVTGYSSGIGTYYDYATIKYYPNGDVAWTMRYNGSADSSDYATDIAVDNSGNVYVTGYSYGGASYDDYLTIKYIQFLRGDANCDKKVTIADVVYIISYLLKSGATPTPLQSADANCDGQVTIADVVYLVSFLFRHGPEPCR